MGAVTAFDIAYLDIWTYHTYQYPKDQFDISFITYQCSSYVLIALFVPLQILWRDVASAKLTAVLTLSDLQYLADHRLFDQLQVWWDVVGKTVCLLILICSVACWFQNVLSASIWVITSFKEFVAIHVLVSKRVWNRQNYLLQQRQATGLQLSCANIHTVQVTAQINTL